MNLKRIKEDIEKFREWIKKVLPQFSVETTPDVIDGIAEGLFYNNIITLWEQAEKGTGFHEAFEAVWNSILTKEQQQALINEFKNRAGTFVYPFTGQVLRYDQATDHQIKETLAEEFKSFMLNPTLAHQQPQKNNFFYKLWNLIKKLIASFSSAKKEEIRSIEELFTDIAKGNFRDFYPTSFTGIKEYRVIKEGASQTVSNTILQVAKSILFTEIASITNTKDVHLLTQGNSFALRGILNKIRTSISFDISDNPELEKYKEYFTPEGYKKYVVPFLGEYLSSLGITTVISENVENDENMGDENNKTKESFIEAMYIDSHKLVGPDMKLLIHTLTEKEYNKDGVLVPKLNPFQQLGENKVFVDSTRVTNILQNLLANTPSFLVRNGKVYSGYELMIEKLDIESGHALYLKGAQKNPYDKGYEWVEELKQRLSKDNPLLRMSFEKSFCTTKVKPVRLIINTNKKDTLRTIDPIIDETVELTRLHYTDLFKEKHTDEKQAVKTNVEIHALPDGLEVTEAFDMLLEMLNIPLDTFNYAKEVNSSQYRMIVGDIVREWNKFVDFNGPMKWKDPLNKDLGRELNKTSILPSARSIYSFYKGFDGYLNEKATLFGIPRDLKELIEINNPKGINQQTYRNAEGEREYSITNNTTISQIINVLNSVETLNDFLATFPHLAHNGQLKLSLQHSQLLKNLFTEDGISKRYTLVYNRIGGVNIEGTTDSKTTAKLSETDRAILRLLHSAEGLEYVMINSDKNSEFALSVAHRDIYDTLLVDGRIDSTTTLGEFTDYIWNTYGKHQLKIYNEMLNYPTKYHHFSAQLEKGEAGFFFKGNVLTNEDGTKHLDINEATFKVNFTNWLINQQKELNTFITENYIHDYIDTGLDFTYINGIIYKTVISTIEQHILFYGDPMFYKLKGGVLDFPKRASAANATKEQILQNPNHWNELYKQTVRLSPKQNDRKFRVNTYEDIEVMLNLDRLTKLLSDSYSSIMNSPTYPFKNDKNKIAKLLGIEADFEVEEVGNFRGDGDKKLYRLSNLKFTNSGASKAYLKMTEADAQAYILTDFYMELMYRSVKLTPEQINTLNWKKAKEILIRSKLTKYETTVVNGKVKAKQVVHPYYKSFSKKQIKWAEQVIKELKKDPQAVLPVLKPQYFGYNDNKIALVPAFLKNSVFPLHFVDLWDETTNTPRFPKAVELYVKNQEKGVDIIGHESGQKTGAIVTLEDGKEQFVSMFDEAGKDPETQTLYETFLGIQTEVPAKRKLEIPSGTQIKAIIRSNLDALADSDPELRRDLDHYEELLVARYELGLRELLHKLGVQLESNGEYKIVNPKKTVEQLKVELNRLKLPINIKDIVELNEDKTDLKYKLEAAPNNYSLTSVLFSIIDKSVVHYKTRGKGSVQVASTLFNDTLDRGEEEVTINGKKKKITTSTNLSFAYDENGEVIGMEVLLPNPFYDIYPDLTWEQFEQMAEKDPRLKELLGYRIPTQSMGQFSKIIVKGFYNPSLGDAVIVPSGIVAVAGSDFDVDKLFIFIPHVKKDKEGNLVYVEYLDDSNSTSKDRYKAYIRNSAFRAYQELMHNLYQEYNLANTNDMFLFKLPDTIRENGRLETIQPSQPYYYTDEQGIRRLTNNGIQVYIPTRKGDPGFTSIGTGRYKFVDEQADNGYSSVAELFYNLEGEDGNPVGIIHPITKEPIIATKGAEEVKDIIDIQQAMFKSELLALYKESKESHKMSSNAFRLLSRPIAKMFWGQEEIIKDFNGLQKTLHYHNMTENLLEEMNQELNQAEVFSKVVKKEELTTSDKKVIKTAIATEKANIKNIEKLNKKRYKVSKKGELGILKEIENKIKEKDELVKVAKQSKQTASKIAKLEAEIDDLQRKSELNETEREKELENELRPFVEKVELFTKILKDEELTPNDEKELAQLKKTRNSLEKDIKALSEMLAEYDEHIRYLDIGKEQIMAISELLRAHSGMLREFFLDNPDFESIAEQLGMMTFDEFNVLPMPQQNTKKAIENKILLTMNKLYSHGLNRLTAFIPNNADTLKSLDTEAKTDTYNSILSFVSQNRFRQANLSSKSLVAFAAIHVTGFAFTQNSKTVLTGHYFNELGDRENLSITLPLPKDDFIDLFGIQEGEEAMQSGITYRLDRMWDTEGNLISSNLSEFFTAIVDATEDPFIINLNINKRTLSVALYLTRLGVSLKDTVSFLKSPLIKEYIRQVDLESGLFRKYLGKNKHSVSKLLHVVISTYNPLEKTNLPINLATFFLNQWGYFDWNHYKEKKQALYEILKTYFESKNIQYKYGGLSTENSVYDLVLYLKYSEQAENLAHVNKALAVVTKNPNTLAETLLIQNDKIKVFADEFLANPDDIFENPRTDQPTYVGAVHRNKYEALKMLSKYQVLADSRIREAFFNPAIAILDSNKYMSVDDKIKILNKWQYFLLTYAAQRKNLLFLDIVRQSLRKEAVELYNELQPRFKTKFKFFSLITKLQPKGEEIEYIIKYRTLNETQHINEAIEQLLEFIETNKESEDPTLKAETEKIEEFLKTLTKYSLIQSGLGFTTVSINQFLPIEYYTEYVSEIVSGIYNDIDSFVTIPFSGLWDAFVRNNPNSSVLMSKIQGEENKLQGGYKIKKTPTDSGEPVASVVKRLEATDPVVLYVHLVDIWPDYVFRLQDISEGVATYTAVPFLGDGRYRTSIDTAKDIPAITKLTNDLLDLNSFSQNQ